MLFVSEQGRRKDPKNLDTKTCMTTIVHGRFIVRPSHLFKKNKDNQWECERCGEIRDEAGNSTG